MNSEELTNEERSRLRSVDRSMAPSSAANDRIAAVASQAFDHAFAARSESESTLVTDTGLQVIADHWSDNPLPPSKSPGRRLVLLAAAAAVVIFGLLALPSLREDRQLVATEDSDLVEFCTDDFIRKSEAVAVFHQAPGGERSRRALENLELLVIDFAEFATDLDDGQTTLGVLDSLATETRRLQLASSPELDASVTKLAARVADAFATLPGQGDCDLSALRP